MNTTADPIYKKISHNLFIIALLIVALYLGQGILVPLFFAILLATLLLPGVKFLEKLKLNKVLSIALIILIALVLISSIIYFLSTQIANFFDDLPTIKQRLTTLITSLKQWIQSNFNVAISKQNKYLKETTQGMQSSQGSIVGTTLLSLTEILSYIVLLPIYTFLILYYRDLIKRFLVDAFKNTDEEKVIEVLHESQNVSQLFIRGLIIEVAIVFALNSTGFLILGIKYAFFLGLVAALLNLVPYIGMLVANIFCMLITIISTENLSDVLWVGAILAAVQFIDNNFLMPIIVGSKVRINALVTIVGVLVGGAICGVSGMFLSIPGLAILKVIFDRVQGLEPYGMLLGDDSKTDKKRKTVTKK